MSTKGCQRMLAAFFLWSGPVSRYAVVTASYRAGAARTAVLGTMRLGRL